MRLLRDEERPARARRRRARGLARAASRDDAAALEALDDALRERGVLRALARAGARDGDEVQLGGETFTYWKGDA